MRPSRETLVVHEASALVTPCSITFVRAIPPCNCLDAGPSAHHCRVGGGGSEGWSPVWQRAVSPGARLCVGARVKDSVKCKPPHAIHRRRLGVMQTGRRTNNAALWPFTPPCGEKG